MEFAVYILLSPKTGKTYVGFTSDLINRMKSHNGLSKKGFTAHFRPWVVIHIEFYETKNDAMSREAFLKSGAGRGWIHYNLKHLLT